MQMVRTMKKIPVKFLMMFLMSGVLMMMHILYNDYVETQIRISNTLLSGKAVTLVFTDHHRPCAEEMQELITEHKVFLTANVYKSADLSVYAYWGNLFLSNFNHMGEAGRRDDFRNTAIVGCKVADSEYCSGNRENESVFQYADAKYKVIKVNTIPGNNMLDHTAFVCAEGNDGFFYESISIDGTGEGEIEAAAKELALKYQVNPVSMDNNFIERYVFRGLDNLFFHVLAAVFELACFVASVMMLLVFYEDEVKTKCIIGIPARYNLGAVEKHIFLYCMGCIGVMTALYVWFYHAVLSGLGLRFKICSFLRSYFAAYLAASVFVYAYYFVLLKTFLKKGIK